MSFVDRVVSALGLKTKAVSGEIERPRPSDPVGPYPQGMASVVAARQWAMNLTPSQLWNNQPYVRIVVPFIARNVAQLGLHTFRRVGETDRRRVRTGVDQALRKPNGHTTHYRLLYALVTDKCLYDRAYWLVGNDSTGTFRIVRIPPARIVSHNATDPLGPVESFTMTTVNGPTVDIPGSNVIHFPGYHPLDPYGTPTSPLDALKTVIAEQAAAFEFRQSTWDNGGQINQVISRPAEAPQWSPEARARFLNGVREEFGKHGGQRGGIALFEDGMALQSSQWNAHEAEWIEASKLALTLVASIYHVNPTMVGLLDNANYSNVREFRRALYGDTLGPLLAEIEDEVNTFLVPKFDDSGRTYTEFNLAEKLQGSFEEQATAFQTAVGGPWMTRAEARSRLNLPALPEDAQADELIVPLNVLIGEQASPTDSAPPATEPAEGPEQDDSRPAGPPSQSSIDAWNEKVFRDLATKARTATKPELDDHRERARETFETFFDRQASVVLSRIPAKAANWWDQGRWDRELAEELRTLGVDTTVDVAAKTLASLDFDPDTYDVGRTEQFIKALAERIAGQVNATTKAQLDAARVDGDPAHVFEVASTSRAEQMATTVVTLLAGFAATESVKQAAGDRAMKIWVTGPRPRPEHAALDGQTVPVDQPFSNGAMWPGDGVLDVDQTAGCNCTVDLLLED